MSEVCLRSELIQLIESLGKESGSDAGFARERQAGHSQHDQIKRSVANDGEVSVHHGREAVLVDEKVAWVEVPVDDIVTNKVFCI